jgi:hypothetical protein
MEYLQQSKTDVAGTLLLEKQSLNYTTPHKAGITLCEIARIMCVIIKSAAPLRFIIGSVAIFITCFPIQWQAVFTQLPGTTLRLPCHINLACPGTINDGTDHFSMTSLNREN